MDKISENYLEEQKRLHTNINYGTASLQHVNTIKNLLINTKLKTITSRWPSGIRSNPEFIMPTMK